MSLILIDTNIVLRGVQPAHPMHREAVDSQIELRRRGEQPCLVAQNLIEFRVVATRPVPVNGLGMSQVEANAEIVLLKSLYPVLADEPGIFPEWERLVTTHGAAGKQNHDARIVAAMITHGISTLLTFNKADFVRYPDITAATPQEVLGQGAVNVQP